mmetsp:Transcript_14022/g.42404  ORF Transcript_14022/g.42404 Transcript_14022/m.42404 type:complete len:223 (+) Transcript_14022:326-994(+)
MGRAVRHVERRQRHAAHPLSRRLPQYGVDAAGESRRGRALSRPRIRLRPASRQATGQGRRRVCDASRHGVLASRRVDRRQNDDCDSDALPRRRRRSERLSALRARLSPKRVKKARSPVRQPRRGPRPRDGRRPRRNRRTRSHQTGRHHHPRRVGRPRQRRQHLAQSHATHLRHRLSPPRRRPSRTQRRLYPLPQRQRQLGLLPDVFLRRGIFGSQAQFFTEP